MVEYTCCFPELDMSEDRRWAMPVQAFAAFINRVLSPPPASSSPREGKNKQNKHPMLNQNSSYAQPFHPMLNQKAPALISRWPSEITNRSRIILYPKLNQKSRL
jgi:hypothetical protein